MTSGQERSLIIDGADGIQLHDEHFIYRAQPIKYAAIASIRYWAMETKHSVNFIPTVSSYKVELDLYLKDGQMLAVRPQKRLFRSTRKTDVEEVWKAKEILSAFTFENRLEPLEQVLSKRGYFPYGKYQLARDGDIFRTGKLVANVRDPNVSLRLAAFHLDIITKRTGLRAFVGMLAAEDPSIPVERDRDCLLYMLKSVYGLSWQGEPIRARRAELSTRFATAILRLCAVLTIADGRVDPTEVRAIKDHFWLGALDDHAKGVIFNEALRSSAKPEQIAAEILAQLGARRELLEYVLIGLLQVATADEEYSEPEHHVFALVARCFGFSQPELEHILALAGLEPPVRQRTGTEAASEMAFHLHVLGLSVGASLSQIKAAYRTLAREHHPDHLGARGIPIENVRAAENVLKQINSSYRWLVGALSAA